MTKEKLEFSFAMILAGTIGLFMRMMTLSSIQVAAFRGLLGCLTILLYCLFSNKLPRRDCVKADLPLLIASGVSLCGCWVLVYLSYCHTTIAITNICFNFAPVIVMAVAPFVLKERLTARKVLCMLLAVAGILMATLPGAGKGSSLGVIYGLLAACFYAAVILLNKRTEHVNSYEKVIVQMGCVAVLMTAWLLISGEGIFSADQKGSILPMLIVGILHTGIAYLCMFSGMNAISAQTTAIMCYIDPVTAVIVSQLIIHENLSIWQLFGIVLVIAGTLLAEMKIKRTNTADS